LILESYKTPLSTVNSADRVSSEVVCGPEPCFEDSPRLSGSGQHFSLPVGNCCLVAFGHCRAYMALDATTVACLAGQSLTNGAAGNVSP